MFLRRSIEEWLIIVNKQMVCNRKTYMDLSNLSLIEETYYRFLVDPNSVDLSWRHFFEGIDFASILFKNKGAASSDDLRVFHLIQDYRTYGHLMANFNPLYQAEKEEVIKSDFKKEEMEKLFPTCGFLKEPTAKLSKIIDALKKTYSGKIGIEYMGLEEPELEKWIQKRIEPYFDLHLSNDDKIRILHQLSKAEGFETFIHTKYVGQKRFSLEGGETLIPMLAAIIDHGVSKVILGMAHRGRLNVLANILNKSYGHIFHEFEDFYSPEIFEGTGDVKYHKGFGGSAKTKDGKEVGVILSANPSHLEAVDPVVEGQARAWQEMEKRKDIVPILIHGDAAIAGQGVVYETMQLRSLNGYATGGTIHIVINNQIGFTTLPKDTRSTRYCTDIARSFGSPVFHVNAEDPETCIAAATMAIEIREQFGCDVFLDLYCYRKYGHNEGDEPSFTQPLEYKIIREKKSILSKYTEKLIQEGVLDEAGAQKVEKDLKDNLNQALDAVKAKTFAPTPTPLQKEDPFKKIETAVSTEKIVRLAEESSTVKEDFHIHPKIQKLLTERKEMVRLDPNAPVIDWGMGETLAYASLVDQGKDVRISGQDCRRGTFSHRHAIWVDQVNDAKYFPLSHIRAKQGLFDIFNSPLSEYAVLGFEFGYSLAHVEALVIWEAQYGDFCNGAQIVIDQYIAACEQKWGHKSGLTLLLPHGYEGQGPEHSSARMERFLQLCGDDNMRVCNCTTPAQLFHLLRRQSLNPVKKPLIIFSPKGLLRHPLCKSSLNDFTQKGFQTTIDDPTENPERVIFCSGRIYYDLLEEKKKRKANAAIVRIEQLYPLDIAPLTKYKGKILWVQEEPQNMGAWEYMQQSLEGKVKLLYAGRSRSASPATGSHTLHQKQHEAVLKAAYES